MKPVSRAFCDPYHTIAQHDPETNHPSQSLDSIPMPQAQTQPPIIIRPLSGPDSDATEVDVRQRSEDIAAFAFDDRACARVYDALPGALFLIDAGNGRILHGNEMAVGLSGYSRAQLIGRTAQRLFRSERGAFWSQTDPAIACSRFAGAIRCKGGDEKTISASAGRIELEGRPVCVLLAAEGNWMNLDGQAHDSRFDAMTGLANREHFQRELEQNYPQMLADGSLALLYIDIDNLKRVNDAHGHVQGDALLVEFARRLRASCNGAALVSRYGSDEFLVVFAGLPNSLLAARRELTAHVERILEAARQPYRLEHASVVGSCSIGVALAPHDAVGQADLLRYADLALQQAKRNQRDSHRFFIEDDLRRLNDELELESTLREVIRYEALDQAWLPMFRLADEACVGVEVLIRGGDALQRFNTRQVIDLASARGLLPELGRLNLRRVAHAFKRLLLSGRDAPIQHLGLNLSAQELLAPGFVDELIHSLSAAALPLNRVVIEVGERELFGHIERLLDPLERLGQQGIRVALDGFGAAFSSLASLRDLPIAMIKIDRRFVWEIERSRRDREIVRAMVQLAHGLGVQVVAVGVETRAQLDALREMGCEYAQGYLLSRPLTLDDLSDFLRRHVTRAV